MRSLFPSELSLGLARRAALARAFATEPAVLFLDEPFVSLDEQTAERLRHLLLAVWSARPTTALMVTHNLREALMLSDRIIVLSPRPAHVLGVFDVRLPRQYRNPQVMSDLLRSFHREVSGRDLIGRQSSRRTRVRGTMPIDPLRRRLSTGSPVSARRGDVALLPGTAAAPRPAAANSRSAKSPTASSSSRASNELMSPANQGAICNLGRRGRQGCGRSNRQRRQHGRGAGLHRSDPEITTKPVRYPDQHPHASRPHFRQCRIPGHRRDHRRPSQPAARA